MKGFKVENQHRELDLELNWQPIQLLQERWDMCRSKFALSHACCCILKPNWSLWIEDFSRAAHVQWIAVVKRSLQNGWLEQGCWSRKGHYWQITSCSQGFARSQLPPELQVQENPPDYVPGPSGALQSHQAKDGNSVWNKEPKIQSRSGLPRFRFSPLLPIQLLTAS